jgi:5'(3')-deoxyribonucleotidase
MERLLIDLDGTIVDLWEEADSRALLTHAPCRWNVEGCCTPYTMDFFGSDDIFGQAKPIPGAIDGVKQLMRTFEVHFVSTPWPTAHDSAAQKYDWVQRYFGDPTLLTLTHHKELIPAFGLIDDKPGLKGPWLHIEYPQAWNRRRFRTWEEGLADYVERSCPTF